MYLDLARGLSVTEKTHSVKNSRFEVYWEGFVFVPGRPAGSASIKSFLSHLDGSPPDVAASMLSGTFACLLLDKETGTWYAFTDFSRCKPLYYTQDAVCSSFVELARRTRAETSDIDPFCVVEFILTGLQFSPNILFRHVRVLDAQEFAEVRPGRSLTVMNRDVESPFEGNPAADPVTSFLTILEETTESLRTSGIKISCDLTGGLDTRLLAAVFDHFGLEFEAAGTGTPHHPDIVIAEKTAELLGGSHTFYPVIQKVAPDSLWGDLDLIVEGTDGVNDAVYSHHRLAQLAASRRERGVELTISGNGGQFFKEGIQWITAFRTRGGEKGKAQTLDRLVSSGVAFWGMSREIPHALFPARLREVSCEYRAHMNKKLRDRFLPHYSSKWKMADAVLYYFSLRAPRGEMITRYNPLLDLDLLSIGFGLKGRERIWHGFHRKALSRVNKRLADLTTSRIGMSMATGVRGGMRDLAGVARWRMSARKRSRTMNSPALYPCLRALPETEKALSDLKDYGFLEPTVELDGIDDVYLGRWLTLFKLIRMID